jgi:hypothetical protein
VHTVEQNLLDATDTTVTLVKPLPARKEPAPEVIERDVVNKAKGGAEKALAWARVKIGHYKEEFGQNRGRELDQLERRFNLVGEPWCAIFATTAVAQAVGVQAKTPPSRRSARGRRPAPTATRRGFVLTRSPAT